MDKVNFVNVLQQNATEIFDIHALILISNSWLTVVVRRMVNVFLHPDIIYKQTQLYQMEMDALARSGVMQDKVILYFYFTL